MAGPARNSAQGKWRYPCTNTHNVPSPALHAHTNPGCTQVSSSVNFLSSVSCDDAVLQSQIMDIILASSRGKGIQSRLRKLHPHPDRLYISARGGAKLETLILDAIRLVKRHPTPSQCHVYFMAGLCDITFRDTYIEFVDYRRRRAHMYEEVSFTEDNTQAVLRVTHIINNMEQELKWLGAKPCFMTIPPCSIQTWNFHRLTTGRTTHLIHHKHYEDMQPNLISVINEINQFIVATNSNNGMSTPFIANTIIQSCGPFKNHRVHYDRLVDGTHATNTTNEKWVKQIIKAIITNRGEKTPDPAQININSIINHNRRKPKRNPRHTALKSLHRTVTKPHTPIVNPHPVISDSSESDSDEVVKRPWRPQ